MMDGTMGQRRSTGLTRAKRIERLTLLLGLPLLLVLLALTAGIVNYSPVRHRPVAPIEAAPIETEAPSGPTMPLRHDRLVPVETPNELGQSLELEASIPLS